MTIARSIPATKKKTNYSIAGSRHQPAKKLPIFWGRKVSRPSPRRLYWLLALGVLLATSAFGAVLGARVQQGNADQLVDAYFFQSGHDLHGAVFPGQHTQLLKWPLFYLVKVLGYSETSFVLVTVGCVLLTVGFLAYVLQRIERRPLVSGTLYLALASVLLLVPAQPYAGGLLPVSMAMLTTRNLEYVVYIGALALLASLPRFRSRRFWAAIVLLTLLIASDKLFLDLSISGALLALVVYSLRKRWPRVSLSANWLVAGGLSAVAAVALLGLINASGLTHIAGQSGAGPYGLVTSLKNVILGAIYGVSGFLTNFGANPAFDATTLKQIPHQLFHHLFSVGGVGYIVNFIIVVSGLWAAYRLFKRSLFGQSDGNSVQPGAINLSLMLLWTTVAALVLFVATNHYYAVDARYLGISLFAVFVALATYGRNRQWPESALKKLVVVLGLSIVLGLFAASSNYHAEQRALANYSQRDQLIAQVLKTHNSQTLVGDYWRVLPIKNLAGSQQPVIPLQSCTQPRTGLTDQAWQTDLYSHSFAYLLSFDGSLTDYPSCGLAQIINAYGRPNSSVLIAGTLSNPQEVLLFYDNGAHHSAPKTNLTATPATVLPINLSDLPNTSCPVPTIMSVVAHQDDDLLFMNPDLLHEIKAGDCVRTVYVTAGDAGASQVYWLSREQGSEAAYASMIGSKDIWVQRIIQLPAGQFAMIANPRDNTKVSLIFLRLPDGNLKGDGFPDTHNESLAKLYGGTIKTMQSVDGQSIYTSNQLSAALTALMHTYQPTEIQTQSNFISTIYPDHSDHMAVGRFVQKAYHKYETQQYNNAVTIPLKFYTGYPSHQFAANVSGADLAAKEAAFLAYAAFDGGVCHTISQCVQTPTYGSYLTRQYREPY